MSTFFAFIILNLFLLIDCQQTNQRVVTSIRHYNRFQDFNNDDTPWVWEGSNSKSITAQRPPNGGSRQSKLANLKSGKECGTAPLVKSGERIVGGREAYVGEFPWHVGLMRKSQNGNQYFCGGAILNEHWVITAAHCMDEDNRRLKPQDLVIVVGIHDLKKIQAKDEYTVDRTIVHEKYQVGKKNEPINDITLLHIPRTIDLSTGLVNTVCLPAPGERFIKNLDVSGWGKTLENGLGTDVLQTVQVFVHGDVECSKGNLKDVFRPKEMFCAGVRRGGKDSCEGDSGGPIVKRKRGKAYLAGLVSFGRGCARKGNSGVYTRVSTYIDWIQRHIN